MGEDDFNRQTLDIVENILILYDDPSMTVDFMPVDNDMKFEIFYV